MLYCDRGQGEESNSPPSSIIIGTEAVPPAEGIIKVTALMVPPAPIPIIAGQEPNI